MSIDDLVSVKCQKRSVHQTTPPKGSWVQKCKRVWKAKPTSRGLSVKCPCPQRNRPPRQTAVESKHAKGFKLPRLHLMACANHEARRLPLRFFHFFCVGGSAPHIICLPLMHSILSKRGRSTKHCSTLFKLLFALRIGNRPPFICHKPFVAIHHFFHDKHEIPSMCSAGRLHAHVHALSTNKSQLVLPHVLHPFGEPTGCPNEDRLRTCHQNLRHGCQSKLTSWQRKQSWANSTCCSATLQCPPKKKTTGCYQQDAPCYPHLCARIHMLHINLACCHLPI